MYSTVTIVLIVAGVALGLICIALCLWCVKRMRSGHTCPSDVRMDGKTVIVTGANTGIGKETAKEMIRRGARVIMACRMAETAKQAAADIARDTECDVTGRLVVMMLDLADLDSVREFAANVVQNEKWLHVLINNAGVFAVPYSKSKQGIELTMATNHFGHFLLTLLLLDLLKKSSPSRIVTVSSSGHVLGRINVEDINYERRSFNTFLAYCDSKLANILFMRELAKKLAGTGVTTYSLHPGGVFTSIHRHIKARLPPWLATCLYSCLCRPLIYLAFSDVRGGAMTSVYCSVAQECQQQTGLYYR